VFGGISRGMRKKFARRFVHHSAWFAARAPHRSSSSLHAALAPGVRNTATRLRRAGQCSCGFAPLRAARTENMFGRLYILRSKRMMVTGAVPLPPDRGPGNRKGFICRKKLIDTMFAWG